MPEIAPDAIYLIDGHSQFYKAFFALQHLSTSKGQPTNAVFGFYMMLQRLYVERKPRFMGVALDVGRESFRTEFYEAYKAQREDAPEEFLAQMPYLQRLIEALNLPLFGVSGFEADDIIATIAARAAAKDIQSVIVSADKDLFQLVGPRTLMLRTLPEKRDAELFDAAAVEKKMGIRPDQMVDYQAIVGDPSDNIPGLPGLGPKFAVTLLEHYPEGIAAMYGDPQLADKLKGIRGFGPSKIKAILENREQAEVSRRLAALTNEVPIDAEIPEAFEFARADPQTLADLFQELEFFSLLRDLEKGKNPFVSGPEAASSNAGEASTPTAADAARAPDISVERRETDYRAVLTAEQLAAVADELRTAERFAFDTETSGLSPMSSGLVGISLSTRPDTGWYIPVGHDSMAAPGGQISLDEVREALGPIFADPRIMKVAHNAKYDVKMLRLHGFEVAGLEFDTMIAAHLIDSSRDSIGLKQLSQSLLGIGMQPISELIGTGKNQISMSEVPVADVTPYASADADCTLQLYQVLQMQIADTPMNGIFREIEMPLIDILDRMERRGIRIDAGYLKGLGKEVDQRLLELERQIYADAGEEFNIKSPKQVGVVLFERLSLPPQKKTKSGFSTDVSVLEALEKQHPVVANLLQYRIYEKLSSTYIKQLPRLIDRRTGRIHCSFNQTVAATGRLSCNDPNLQNIPTRTDLGRQIRRAFVASEKNRVLLSADYSQIELRILAHMSGDEALRQAYAEGRDVHALTASKIYGVEPAEVTREQRGVGKTINFGVIYGMSAFRLANDLSIERDLAGRFIKDYFAGYPAVTEWIERTKEDVREKGYAETMCGRRRPIPDINARQHNRRSAAERVAVNTPIQGTAADLIKKAMLEVDRRLEEELPSCHMLLQVHDELLFDLPEADVARATEIIRESMTGALKLDVPLDVDVNYGPTWADCK